MGEIGTSDFTHRLNVVLPRWLVERLRVQAELEGEPMSTLVRRALRDYLGVPPGAGFFLTGEEGSTAERMSKPERVPT